MNGKNHPCPSQAGPAFHFMPGSCRRAKFKAQAGEKSQYNICTINSLAGNTFEFALRLRARTYEGSRFTARCHSQTNATTRYTHGRILFERISSFCLRIFSIPIQREKETGVQGRKQGKGETSKQATKETWKQTSTQTKKTQTNHKSVNPTLTPNLKQKCKNEKKLNIHLKIGANILSKHHNQNLKTNPRHISHKLILKTIKLKTNPKTKKIKPIQNQKPKLVPTLKQSQ